MEDGLYKVLFNSQLGVGSGVVVLSDGRFRGGDAGIAYVGTISQGADGTYTAALKTFRHSVTGTGSVLGVDNAEIILTGTTPNTTNLTLSASIPGTQYSFQANLTKIAP